MSDLGLQVRVLPPKKQSAKENFTRKISNRNEFNEKGFLKNELCAQNWRGRKARSPIWNKEGEGRQKPQRSMTLQQKPIKHYRNRLPRRKSIKREHNDGEEHDEAILEAVKNGDDVEFPIASTSSRFLLGIRRKTPEQARKLTRMAMESGQGKEGKRGTRMNFKKGRRSPRVDHTVHWPSIPEPRHE